jgi:hypothetical protein
MARERRSRREFRFESLEGRELLSAALAPAEIQAARRPAVVVFRGTLQGRAFPGPPATILPPTEEFVLSGRGTLSHLGPVTFLARYTQTEIHITAFPASGIAQIAKGMRGSFDFTLDGTGDFVGPGRSRSHLTGQVTGGTGAFGGASGSVSAALSVNARTQRFSLLLSVQVPRS